MSAETMAVADVTTIYVDDDDMQLDLVYARIAALVADVNVGKAGATKNVVRIGIEALGSPHWRECMQITFSPKLPRRSLARRHGALRLPSPTAAPTNVGRVRRHAPLRRLRASQNRVNS